MANRAQRRQWSREINGGMTLLYTFNIVDIFVGGGGEGGNGYLWLQSTISHVSHNG